MRLLCTGLLAAALACAGQTGTAPEVLTLLAPASPAAAGTRRRAPCRPRCRTARPPAGSGW